MNHDGEIIQYIWLEIDKGGGRTGHEKPANAEADQFFVRDRHQIVQLLDKAAGLLSYVQIARHRQNLPLGRGGLQQPEVRLNEMIRRHSHAGLDQHNLVHLRAANSGVIIGHETIDVHIRDRHPELAGVNGEIAHRWRTARELPKVNVGIDDTSHPVRLSRILGLGP